MNLNNEPSKLGDYFTNAHIGGSQDDTQQQFTHQNNLLNNEKNEFNEIIDINRKAKRDNDVDLVWRELHERNYRFNNNPVTVDKSFVVSNDLVYPKEYDPYFEYLYKKGLRDVNVQVQLSKTRINIDSTHSLINPSVTVQSYINLPNNPLTFTNNSSYFTINYKNANQYFTAGDLITLTGMEFYKVNYKQLKIFFTNNSNEVVLNIAPNFNFNIPYYDIVIQISNITNNGLDYYKNIPLTVINSIQHITSTTSVDSKISFTIPFPFSTLNTTDETLISDCTITYFYLGNYPINLINAKYPISQYNLLGYQTIFSVQTDTITIALTNILSLTNATTLNSGTWLNNSFSTGGNSMQIGKITNIEKSYTNLNDYTIPLESNLNNILCIKMISSEFVNTQKVFNNDNSKLYWQNSLDYGTYSISIPSGNYDTISLKSTIEKLMNSTPRKIINSPNLIPINNFTINFNTDANITSFVSYNSYQLPNCLESLDVKTVENSSGANYEKNIIYTIKIKHPEHNQQVNDNIIITNSTNYYKINNSLINTTHTITKVINNDYYEITLIDINQTINDAGDTKGGYEIIIQTYSSFRLLFDKLDTFGGQIGFPYAGNSNSITPFCNINNNYTITNQQSYVFNINQIIIINNNVSTITNSVTNINLNGYQYFLIRCDGLNQNINPNGLDFFYKILLNGKPNTSLFNSFVDTPIYFNPPLNELSELHLTYTDPNGKPWLFYNINHSFTLEITTVSNFPANTNLSTYMSKL